MVRWSGWRLMGGMALTVLCFGAVACGNSAESLCADFCDCTGCSDDEQTECVDDLQDLEKAAEEDGCGDQLDELYACWDDQIRCDESRIDVDGCESEERSLAKCAGVNFGSSASSTGESAPSGG